MQDERHPRRVSRHRAERTITRGVPSSCSSSEEWFNMKTAGVIILIAGLLMTLYTGFTYVTKEKVVDLGVVEITKDNQHTVNWQPYIGIGVMVIGGAFLILARKKSLAN
jgi:hypothetical protein